MKPKLLDLFCGAGGCSMGYYQAGFDVVGVDINPQPNYPFKFIQADAMTFTIKGFQAVHASPPCQRYSVTSHLWKHTDKEHPNLLLPTRQKLQASGVPWVIENVPNSPMSNPFILCGLMFGLRVLRHRLFECSRFSLALPKRRRLLPPHPTHPRGNLTNSHRGYSDGANGFVTVMGHNFCREAAAKAMQIDWMSKRELAQAIPPAYTEFIGQHLIKSL